MNHALMFRRNVAALSAVVFVCCAGAAMAAPTEVSVTGGMKAPPVRSPGSPADLSIVMSPAERAEAARAAEEFASNGRGLLGPVLMRDNLEAYIPGSTGGLGIYAPPSFLDPPDFPWGLNNLRGQGSQSFVSLVDLSGSPLGGSNGVVNASQALRIFTSTAQPAGGFFTGANLRWEPVLVPGADMPAQGSWEIFLSGPDDLYTFETVNGLSGFVTARMLWGGPCTPEIHGDCGGGVEPPITPPYFYFLGLDPDSFTTGLFMPTAYCMDAYGEAIVGCMPPAGIAVGDPAPIPTQNWSRLTWSFGADGTMTALLDRQDGSGNIPIAQSLLLTSASLNRIGSNAGFYVQDASMHIDNIEASGYVFEQPVPPALECPYLDSMEWLNPGPLLGQSARWFASLSGGVSVVEDGARGQVLQQVNAGFDQYTESADTVLPTAFAFPGNPWSVCFDAYTTGETVRGFSIGSGLGVTRVFLGHYDESDPENPFFDPTVFVQINPDFNPANDGPPIVGVDIASTGYQWTPGVYRTVCMTVSVDDTLEVLVDGASIYTGEAFSTTTSSFAIESGNNAAGAGSVLRVDNVFMACADPSGFGPPELTLPYCDDFEWATPGIPPGASFGASGRYSSASGATVELVDLAPGGTSQVVAMPNVFADTPHAPTPDINDTNAFVFTQFTSHLPGVEADLFGGWRLSMDLAMNDFTTSRGFSPAQEADVGGAFELDGYFWYHAPNDRFYLFASPDGAEVNDDLITIDTGHTRAGLGITADSTFTVSAEYVPVTGKIRWSVNGVVIGTTNPILGTDDLGAPRLHKNLDAVFVWGGDDDTAPTVAPLSTLFLDNLCVVDTERCYSDANGDGIVNFADLNLVLTNFGVSGTGYYIPGDVVLDSIVNFQDLNSVLANFGQSCD